MKDIYIGIIAPKGTEVPPEYDTMIRLLAYDVPAGLQPDEKRWREFAKWVVKTMLLYEGRNTVENILVDESYKIYPGQPTKT